MSIFSTFDWEIRANAPVCASGFDESEAFSGSLCAHQIIAVQTEVRRGPLPWVSRGSGFSVGFSAVSSDSLDLFLSSTRILLTESRILAANAGSDNNRTSETARSTIGYLGVWMTNALRQDETRSLPVQFLHQLPIDSRLRHVL